MVVPFHLTLDDGGAAEAQGAPHRRPIQPGHVVLEGENDRFVLTSRERPTSLTLDPRGEILASFYSEQTHPKKVATLKAASLWIVGDTAAAERMFHDALAAAAGEADKATFAQPWMQASPYVQQRENARIHLRLARLALDRDDEDTAFREIAEAVEILGSDDHSLRIERAALEGRIDLRHGNFDQAFQRAKRALRLFSPRRQQRYWRLRGWQAQVGDWHATTDVLAVLAVAALETGRVEESRWAIEGAAERGVDLSAIEPLIQARLR